MLMWSSNEPRGDLGVTPPVAWLRKPLQGEGVNARARMSTTIINTAIIPKRHAPFSMAEHLQVVQSVLANAVLCTCVLAISNTMVSFTRNYGLETFFFSSWPKSQPIKMKHWLKNGSLETSRMQKIKSVLIRISNFQKCLNLAPPSWGKRKPPSCVFEQDGGKMLKHTRWRHLDPPPMFKHGLKWLILFKFLSISVIHLVTSEQLQINFSHFFSHSIQKWTFAGTVPLGCP